MILPNERNGIFVDSFSGLSASSVDTLFSTLVVFLLLIIS